MWHPNFSSQVKLYNEKRSDLEEQQLHLNVGLQKIRETVDQVEELQSSLSIKKNELEKKNALANQKLRQMVSTKQDSWEMQTHNFFHPMSCVISLT